MEQIVGSYNDFRGLASLKVKARNDESSAAREVGQQFEAFFIHEMLKSMRKATSSMKSGMWDSSTTDTYNQMFDQELATVMAKGEGLGVTEWLVGALNDQGGSRNLQKSMGVDMYRDVSSRSAREKAQW